MPNKIPANTMALLTGHNKTCTGVCTGSIKPKAGTNTTFILALEISDLEFDLELDPPAFTIDDNNDTGSDMLPHNSDITKIYASFSNTAATTIIAAGSPVTVTFQMAVQTGVDVIFLNLRTADIRTNGVKVRSGE